MAAPEKTPVEKLEALGVRHGILMKLARDGQLIDVRCEMPQCYCFKGCKHFEPRTYESEARAIGELAHDRALAVQRGRATVSPGCKLFQCSLSPQSGFGPAVSLTR